jgi:transporter family-2 protein
VNAFVVLLCLASGALLPAQAAVNGKAAHFLNSPFRGGLVSFAGGFLILLILSFATTRSWPSLSSIGTMPWYAWVGGSVGSLYVVSIVLAAPRIGALQMLVALTVGQAISSVVLERQGWIFYPQHAITAPRAVGVAAVVAGLILVRL